MGHSEEARRNHERRAVVGGIIRAAVQWGALLRRLTVSAIVGGLLLAGCARVTSGAAAPAAVGAPEVESATAAAPAAEAATAPAPCPQPASATRPVDRVAGADRYATAACASRAAFPASTSGTVVLARGDDAGGWADALAGTVLAQAVDGPVVLTDPAQLPDPTASELGRLQPRTVLVLGGQAAITEAVVAQVRAAAPAAAVRRIAGPDRYATAVAVSAEAGTGGTAFVVNGFRPADALVAGAPAARAGAALLLVSDAGVPAVTADALQQVREVTVVGGYGVVPASVEAQLAELVGRDHLRRVSGGDRTETAASVARAFPVDGRIHLANGGRLVDAIGAGWSAARTGGGPVLYAERTQPGHGTDRYLRLGGLRPVTPVRLVGGTAVLAPELVAALEARYDEAASGGPPPQLRAMWVHLFDATLKSRASIDRALDAAAAANLNTVIVEVARRQDAYYTSSVLPRTPDPQMPADLDLLARLLPAARDRGLAVHAWVPALPAWHERYAGQRLPMWEAHGAGSADPWVSVDAGGRQGTFFDPGVPAVADHVVAVFRELAERYAIDAVHVDYLRYESDVWGYHPASLQRFRQATGATGTPSPNDPAWSDWRREQTRQLATRIRDAVRQVAPHVAVTMAGSTIGEPPASTSDYRNTKTWGGVFQAWPDWLREGLVDAVFPMNYFDASTRAAWFDGWVAFERRLHAECGCRLAVGVGAWLNTPDASLQQVRSALDASDGAVVYSYQQNARGGYPPQALLGALRDGPFAAPAPPPPLR